DVRPTDIGTILRTQPLLLPGALGAEPEGEPGDLHGAGIDVDAVEVVLDDKAWDIGEEGGLVGILNHERHEGGGRLLRFSTAVRDFPGFVVDNLEQVEGIKSEVHGA